MLLLLLLLLLLEEEKYLLDEWVFGSIDRFGMEMDRCGFVSLYLYTYIKATDEMAGKDIEHIKWSRSDGWMMLVSLNLSSSAERGKFGMTLQDG